MANTNHKKWVMYPGRWQPLHEGHINIISQAIDRGENVWIAMRKTELSDSDPYSIQQRIQMIKRAFGDLYGDRVIATTIPDIAGIRYGRGVGYFVEEAIVSKEIAKISATNIRAGKDKSLHTDVSNYLQNLESTIWFTGLPCSGKTTLAEALRHRLTNFNKGYRIEILDGDDVRKRLNSDLGFSTDDRAENLRRVSEVSQLFNNKKITVLASFVSPTNTLRQIPLDLIKNLKTVYVKCPVEECEKRDVKGMYAEARAGKRKGFTGIDAPFEEPANPQLIVDTQNNTIEECVDQIIKRFDF